MGEGYLELKTYPVSREYFDQGRFRVEYKTKDILFERGKCLVETDEYQLALRDLTRRLTGRKYCPLVDGKSPGLSRPGK